MVNYYGGQGPMVNAVLWTEFSIALVAVALRFYARKYILRNIGWDDYLIIPSIICFALQNAFLSKAAANGIGLPFGIVQNSLVIVKSTKYAVISSAFYIMGIPFANSSVAGFLLRIVIKRWHRMILWCCIVTIFAFSIASTILLFLQCKPVEYIWDRFTTGGKCWIYFPVVATITSAWSPLIDFTLAFLPMPIVWNLNIKRREKITVAIGLSLNAIAGTCGVVRTVKLRALFQAQAAHLAYNTLPMVIWSATELFTSIMVACLPIIRPLFIIIVYGRHETTLADESRGYALQDREAETIIYTGPDRSVAQTTIDAKYQRDNVSEESFLREMNNQQQRSAQEGIKVREEVMVTISSNKG